MTNKKSTARKINIRDILEEQAAARSSNQAESNGHLDAIFTLAGFKRELDVYIWPSLNEPDGKLRRAAAYARASFYIEDKYLVTWRDNPQYVSTNALYQRMHKFAESCLEKSGARLDHHRNCAYTLIGAFAKSMANQCWEEEGWGESAAIVNEQVKMLGCKDIIPEGEIDALDFKTDDPGYESLDMIYDNIAQVQFAQVDKKPAHLRLVK